jgi:DNA-binding NarL/FixJ family response regulator
MRIGVICSNPLIQGALESLLRIETDFQVVGSGSSCGAAEAIAGTLQPDLLIVTEECVDEEGLETMRRLRAEFGLKTMLVIGGSRAHGEVAEAFDAVQSSQAGVGSFLLRVRDLVPEHVAPRAAPASPVPEAETGGVFTAKTAREAEVGRLVAQGYTNRRIAAMIGLTETTIKVYVGRLLRTAGCDNRTQLAIKLASAGSVQGPDSEAE